MPILSRGRLYDPGKPIDPAATPETVAVYRRLLNDVGSGRLFSGIHDIFANLTDDTQHYDTEGKFLQVSGGHEPLMRIVSFTEPDKNPSAYAASVAWCKEQHEMGAIVGIDMVPRNYTTTPPTLAYNRSKTDITPVSSLIGFASAGAGTPGAQWRAYLDKVATFCKTDMVDSQGKNIPIIFRMFGEHNGWFDYASWNIQSIAKKTIPNAYDGIHYALDITLTTAMTTDPANAIQAGSQVNFTGLTPAVMNQAFGCVAVNGAQTVITVDVGKTDPGTVTVSSGTCYAVSGFWWAGVDRAAALCTVWQETVDYIINTKAVHNVLFAWCNMPFDGINYWSTNPAVAAYSNWWPGAQYVDMIGTDYYDRRTSVQNVSFNKTALIDSCKSAWELKPGAPFYFAELGLDHAGKERADFWTTEMPNMRKFYPFCRGICFWDPGYFPVPSDPAAPGFAIAMSDPSMIGI